MQTIELVKEIDKFLDVYGYQTKNLWSVYVANYQVVKELVVGDILQTDYRIVNFITNTVIFHCKLSHNIHGDVQHNTLTKQLDQIQSLYSYLSGQENFKYYQENKI